MRKLQILVFHFRASSLNNLGYVYQNINNHKEAVNAFEALKKEFIERLTIYLFCCC